MLPLFFHHLFQSAKTESDLAAFERLNALSPRISTIEESVPHPEEKTIICRESIVNRQERVVGHEFMLKKNITERVHTGHAMRRLYDQALLSQLLNLPLLQLLGHRFAVVHFEASHILETQFANLHGQHCVFVLRFGDEPVTDAICQHVIAWRKMGFMFGILAHECMNLNMDALMVDIDLLVLDLNEAWVFSPDIVAKVMAHTHWPLLACHIDSYEAFDCVWESTLYAERVMFFQGPFITARDAWGVNPIAALRGQVQCLLDLIEQEANTLVLLEALKADPVLLYKLLRMAKSQISDEIGSAEQALLLIGRGALHRWLLFMLHSQSDAVGCDLLPRQAALRRGRFMQNLAEHQLDNTQCQHIFLTGVLSQMEEVLQQPLIELLKALNTPNSINAALLNRSGPYFAYLQLASAAESQQFHTVSLLCKALDLSPHTVKNCQHEASVWAEQIQARN
ncbi:hypothetical protein HQN60_05315 [Deefgea piscis]|uniref:HDOD domain-containing protein n=1 Tax=Deefgea piscis TaxID=2739061 RepID=A0A6M8STN0_9NEIS|nr:hypothetical protein [Deefgea piscis]QKJ66179.1 hypothetical protein HQN60_05315 [Deefgea piscis]